MDASTIATLIEACDMALDANYPTPTITPPKNPNPNKLCDWEWIVMTMEKEAPIDMPPWVARMQNTPIIGSMIRSARYDNIQYVYNVSVNFIDGNKKAIEAIKHVVEEKEYLQVILDEATRNLELAKEYRTENIDEIFPEVAKVIQFRRAQYLILNE